MKNIYRFCFMVLFLTFSMNLYADDKTFFSSFMMVCAKNIKNLEVVEGMAKHFKYNRLPKEYWPKSKDFQAWIFNVDDEKYVLSIDKVDGKSLCAMEGFGIDEKKTRLMLKGFFLDGGSFKLSETIPEDENYIWQEQYIGRLKSFDIDNVFSIKQRDKSTTLVIIN